MVFKTPWDTLLLSDQVLLYKDDQFAVAKDQAVGVKQGRIVFVKSVASIDKEFDALFKKYCHTSGFVKAGERGFQFPEGSSGSPLKKVYRFKNHVLSPGFVNTHTHLPMSLFRGVADNLPLKEWLENYIFPLEKKFVREDFAAAGTRLSALELIKSGVTTLCNMYFYEETIAEVVDAAGLRGVICIHIPHLRKSHFPEHEWQQATRQLQKKYQGNPRILPALSPHAPYTVDSRDLKKLGAFARAEQLPLSIHVSESQWEQKEIFHKHKKTPVEHLHQLGVTGERSLFVHGVYANQSDLQILKDTGTALSYNPESNMKLSNGTAPITEALKLGVRVGLGTDGSASNNNLNFFGEMDCGIKLQALKYGDQSMNFMDMFKMATIGGAKALHLDQDIGTIEEGKWADLIAIDLKHPQLCPAHNILSNLVYSAIGNEVDFVMGGGEILMENYQVKTLDEDSIYQQAHAWGDQIQAFLKKTINK